MNQIFYFIMEQPGKVRKKRVLEPIPPHGRESKTGIRHIPAQHNGKRLRCERLAGQAA
jgi:hypothetical protein